MSGLEGRTPKKSGGKRRTRETSPTLKVLEGCIERRRQRRKGEKGFDLSVEDRINGGGY